MKKYVRFSEIESNQTGRAKYDELLLFQSLLRSSEELNVRYHGKANEIADGIQPWIDALELSIID